MNFDESNVSNRVGERSVRLVTKLLLAAGSVAFVAYLLTLLPGIDRLVPQTPVTFAAILGAIATAVIVVLVVYAAPRIALLVEMGVEGPREVVEEIAAVVQWTVVLAAILIAHRGFAELVVPLLDGNSWLYDVGFLFLAFPVVVFVAVHLFRGVDPSADLLAARFSEYERADASSGENAARSEQTGRASESSEAPDRTNAN